MLVFQQILLDQTIPMSIKDITIFTFYNTMEKLIFRKKINMYKNILF
jgi:hypothetical protein